MGQQVLVIVGAGLEAGLLALRLLALRAPPAITLIDEGDGLFGPSATIRADDLVAGDLDWLGSALVARWAGQSVRLPGSERRFSSPYYLLSPEGLRGMIGTAVTIERGRARAVSASAVTLQDGRRLVADLVIDARALTPHPALVLGYHRSFGLEVDMARPHGLADPVTYDLSVAQGDGFRRLRLLPFSPTRLLVEESRYSADGTMDDEVLNTGISAHAREHGWSIDRVVAREKAQRPVALAFDAERYFADLPADVPVIGARAGLFHPVTGETVSEALQTARLVGNTWDQGGPAVALLLRSHALGRAREHGFLRRVSRALFGRKRPNDRVVVLSRFFGLESGLVARTLSGRSTLLDKARMTMALPGFSLLQGPSVAFEGPLLARGASARA
jgi:lycopene beta-cyclase